MMPPETWAMPLVMMVISSDRVTSGRNGRMESGASVWPMKMLAATLSDSAPLAPMSRGHHARRGFDDDLHDAPVIKQREKCGDENDGGKAWKAKMKPRGRVFLPSSPKTNDEP